MTIQILVELPEDMNTKLTELAAKNRRSKRKECLVAIDHYLASNGVPANPFLNWHATGFGGENDE